MIPDEYLSLEIAECMDRCGVTGEDDNIGSSDMESFYSLLGQLSDLLATTVSIGSIGRIHFEDHIDVWEFFLELSHHDLPTESRVKKSNNHKKIKKLLP
jgi:hypothetical protein